MPNLKFNIVFEVYFVESENEIKERIDQINFQQVLTEKDKIEMDALTTFCEVFKSILGNDYKDRRFATQLLKSHILKDPEFIRKIQYTTNIKIKQRLLDVSNEYKELYNEKKRNDASFDKKILGKAILHTHLYQLCDDTFQWLYKL